MTSTTNTADMELDDPEEKRLAKQEPQNSAGSTLLPAPIAGVVSLVARSSSLYLRLGTLIGGLALDGARVTTLTGLELSRAIIESILYRAGKDVSERTTGELGRTEAEGLLERSIATLHSTITNISFAASTGFYISAVALTSATDLSQQLLVTLDSILGSTDSSRAIASIITLIRREFQNPATGQVGDKVSVSDLLLGICGLALLQRWCKRMTDAETRERKYEEIVWDVVSLDDGRRVDVVGTGTPEKALTRAGSRNSVTFMTASGEELVQTVEREGGKEDSDDDMPEINLKQRIMQSLPPDASVSITTSTTTTKTITVQITSTDPPDLSPPPGVEIIEEEAHRTGDINFNGTILTSEQKKGSLIPKYRIVYQIVKNELRGTDIAAGSAVEEAKEVFPDEKMIDLDTSPSSGFVVAPIQSPETEEPPEVPKKPSHTPQSSSSSIVLTPQSIDSGDEKPHGFMSIPLPKEITANQKNHESL